METTNPVAKAHTVAWAMAQKIAFRFFFIFFMLSTFFAYNVINTIFVPFNKWGKWMSFLDRPIYWLDSHFYHIGYKLGQTQFFGFSDEAIGWVLIVTITWIAIAGCIIWSIADRKRRDYNKLNYWFRTYLAYYLFLAMILYAVEKIIPVQMSFPNADTLLLPLGYQGRFRLLWNFIGASPGYSLFTGTCELLAALLVLSRRTRVFGCLFMTTVLVNVVCLNIFYNVSVKISCTNLLLVTLYLLAPYIPKLVRLFYKLQPVSFAEKRYTFSIPWKKYVMIVLLAGPVFATYTSIATAVRITKREAAERHNQRVYDVETFIKGNDTLPPLTTDTFRFKRLIFASNRGNPYTVVYYMDDELDYLADDWDSTKKTITINGDTPGMANGIFHYMDLSKDTLTVTGTWQGQPVKLLLKKFDVERLPLSHEKIKWVQ